MDIKIVTTVETKLGTLDWKKSPEAHITLKNSGADAPCVSACKDKPCTTVCPAKVYEWLDATRPSSAASVPGPKGPGEAAHKKIIVNYENCIECGACRMLCPFDNITCEWPGGGFGVKYKYG